MFHAAAWDARKPSPESEAESDRLSELFSADGGMDGDRRPALPGNQALLRKAGGRRARLAQRPSQSFAFPTWRIAPIDASLAADLIPREGGEDDDVDFAPGGDAAADGGTPAPKLPPPTVQAPAAQPQSDSCDVPRSMNKVTSGNFLGGLKIADYFPKIASRGYPATAGPFDLANRAGSAVQLYGVIPSPCQPSRFSLAQTAHPARHRKNGIPNADEGTTFDDIARSGSKSTTAPFRQDMLGGGAAPLGYIISMADPPSMTYDASITAGEFDLDLVTSLVGPGGSKSVNWSISVRVANGKVTKNTVT